MNDVPEELLEHLDHMSARLIALEVLFTSLVLMPVMRDGPKMRDELEEVAAKYSTIAFPRVGEDMIDRDLRQKVQDGIRWLLLEAQRLRTPPK
jgi:hypothetical protein